LHCSETGQVGIQANKRAADCRLRVCLFYETIKKKSENTPMINDPKELLRWARGRGWTANKTRGGHWRLRHPNGAIVFMSSTPSDWRTMHNARAKLLRTERSRRSKRK
jgi:predicted RNA binding protein YcfA (HicA-like mRNA interferase family)